MYLCRLYTLAFVSQPVLTWIPPPTQYQTENLASTDKKSIQKLLSLVICVYYGRVKGLTNINSY